MASNINLFQIFSICQLFTNQGGEKMMLGIIDKLEHYWKDHKAAVIVVAVVVVVLAIM